MQKNNNKIGLLLLVDFEKAFDSISFKYIEKVLKYFKFGANIINWVSLLLNNFTASVCHAGNISRTFQIGRGCRQGDPLSSGLFILCIELLSIKLRGSKGIKGYSIGDIEILLSTYADDLSIFLTYTHQNLRNAVKILGDFYDISGLRIQVTKTQCILIGTKYNPHFRLCPDIDLTWDQNFKLLGVQFDALLENMEINIANKVEEINKTMTSWQYRFLSILGRNTVAKTFLLPKLTHLAMSVPTIDKKTLNIIESKIYRFIWGGTDKVRRIDAKCQEKQGGLNFPDIYSSWSSFKFSWLRRLIDNPDTKWAKILEYYIKLRIPDFKIEK